MQAVTAAMGKGADPIVIDDQHNVKGQENTNAIKRDVEEYRSSIASRLHQDDLTA
jgi:hypothetical protein